MWTSSFFFHMANQKPLAGLIGDDNPTQFSPKLTKNWLEIRNRLQSKKRGGPYSEDVRAPEELCYRIDTATLNMWLDQHSEQLEAERSWESGTGSGTSSVLRSTPELLQTAPTWTTLKKEKEKTTLPFIYSKIKSRALYKVNVMKRTRHAGSRRISDRLQVGAPLTITWPCASASFKV